MWHNNRRQRNRGRRTFKPSFFKYLDSIPGILYWPFNELTGTTAKARYNGAYNSSYDGTITSATIGQSGAGRIPYSYYFDGINDLVVNQDAIALANLPLTKGEITVFAKLNAGEWGNVTLRTLFRLSNGTTDLVEIRKNNPGQLLFNYATNSTSFTVAPYGFSTYDWFMASIKFMDANNGNLLQGYFNNASIGTNTGFTVPSSTPTKLIVGAATTTPSWLWAGNIACLIYSPEPFTDNQRTQIYTRSGI